MKTIGLLGAMGRESAALGYCLVEEAVRARLGDLDCARLVPTSVDVATVEATQRAGRYDGPCRGCGRRGGDDARGCSRGARP